MRGATDYEDKGDLKDPVNQVVAILPSEADLKTVIAELGSKRREIAVLLKQHGATFVNSYGWFSIEGLG
jgi:hypothetical protein